MPDCTFTTGSLKVTISGAGVSGQNINAILDFYLALAPRHVG